MILMNGNSNVNKITSKGTALHLACKCKNREIIALILSKNPDIGFTLITNKFDFIRLRDPDGKLAFDFISMHEISPNTVQDHIDSKPVTKTLSKGRPIIMGFLYKIRNLLVSGGNTRYFILDIEEGTFIRYKTKEDYPFSPKFYLQIFIIIFFKRETFNQRHKESKRN